MISRGSRRFYWRPRRKRCVIYMLILTLGCMSSAIAFAATLYATSDDIIELVTYIFSNNPEKSRFPLSSREIVKFYEPRYFPGQEQSVDVDYYIYYNEFDYQRSETLTYKSRTYSDNIEILYRIPKRTPVSAVLLLFHSCRNSAADWFQTPERQRIIGGALDLGYACLAFQATDNATKCWSNDADIYANNDIKMVLKGLRGFYKEYPELALLPRFTFGSSSGGIFSSIFAVNQEYDIQGQVIYTSIILPEILYTYVKARNYPATVWIHMLRDIEFASEQRINISKEIFTEQKIPCHTLPIEPVRLAAMTFRSRIPSVTRETSRYIYYQLQRNRWLNYHNFLLYNPRRKFAWQSFLFPGPDANTKDDTIGQNINENKKQIIEFLNTVYGEHEISFERSFEALKWLQNSSKKTS